MGHHLGSQRILPPSTNEHNNAKMDVIPIQLAELSDSGHALRLGTQSMVGQQIHQAHKSMDEQFAVGLVLVGEGHFPPCTNQARGREESHNSHSQIDSTWDSSECQEVHGRGFTTSRVCRTSIQSTPIVSHTQTKSKGKQLGSNIKNKAKTFNHMHWQG